MHDRASRQLDGAGGVCIALAPYLDQFDRRPVSGIAYLAFLAAMPLTGVAVPLPCTAAVEDPSGSCRSLSGS